MGQYDPRELYIHMNPEQAAQAAQDLHAKALLPAHVGKFNLARHAWFEPFERISAASQGKPYRLLSPMMGEALRLNEQNPLFQWWRKASPALSALHEKP